VDRLTDAKGRRRRTRDRDNCAGRVIRAAPDKQVAEVHDYHDRATPILAASLPRRMPGYRAFGFTRA
jgi:hypothetical protein